MEPPAFLCPRPDGASDRRRPAPHGPAIRAHSASDGPRPSPYHVVAELQDYHRQLGFRVYDADNETIDTFEGNLVQDLKNPANLKRMILQARAAVERQQRVLKPWSFEG